ncbi:MAG: ATP-binding cassette domain-containing protein, partial [Desulfovibrionales bacterium]
LNEIKMAELAGERFSALSYGQQRQILLARALAGDPRILILDEPLSGLDGTARSFWKKRFAEFARSGGTLVIASHYGEDLPPVMTGLVALQKGKVIVLGPWREDILQPH